MRVGKGVDALKHREHHGLWSRRATLKHSRFESGEGEREYKISCTARKATGVGGVGNVINVSNTHTFMNS